MDTTGVGPYSDVLRQAHAAAIEHLHGVDSRPVGVDCGPTNLSYLDTVLGGELTDDGVAAGTVIADLARCARRGVVASGSGRFHGLVVGGTLPVAVAADWLVSAWDQCAVVFDTAPLTSVAERAALAWTVELLGLGGTGATGGLTQGSTEAHEVALHAACTRLLATRGWDLAADGMWGAPPFPVLVSADAHASVWQALRCVGIGRSRVTVLPTDEHGRMRVDALDRALAADGGPGVVVVSAGEINTGSFDRIGEIVDRTGPRGWWCHVDGAFGLWAAACPPLRHLTAGLERADSWATDFHKMLQSTYDGGVVLCRWPELRAAVRGEHAPYLSARPAGVERVRGTARRARGVPAWAVLRSLGRRGVAELIWRCHAHATRLAELVAADPAVRVANQVVYNQVLLDVAPPGLGAASADRFVGAVVDRIRAEGTCWLGATRWRGTPMLRVSFADWRTTSEQVAASAAAILRAVRDTRGRVRPRRCPHPVRRPGDPAGPVTAAGTAVEGAR